MARQFSARELIARANDLGIILLVTNGELHIRASRGATITEQARRVLTANDSAIIYELTRNETRNDNRNEPHDSPTLRSSQRAEPVSEHSAQASVLAGCGCVGSEEGYEGDQDSAPPALHSVDVGGRGLDEQDDQQAIEMSRRRDILSARAAFVQLLANYSALLQDLEHDLANNPPLCSTCLDAGIEQEADGEPVEDNYYCVWHKLPSVRPDDTGMRKGRTK